jgi:hypothetical protein
VVFQEMFGYLVAGDSTFAPVLNCEQAVFIAAGRRSIAVGESHYLFSRNAYFCRLSVMSSGKTLAGLSECGA